MLSIQTQHLNKSLSIQKVKAEQHVKDLTVKLEEYHKSLSRLQGTLNTRDINIVSLEASKRDLEQLHEAGEEKLRQVEFAESQACEQRDEAEESYVLLLCELEGTTLHYNTKDRRYINICCPLCGIVTTNTGRTIGPYFSSH